MKKKLAAAVLLLALLLTLASCAEMEALRGALSGGTTAPDTSADGGTYEDTATKYEFQTVRINGYFGITLTLPVGWWEYYVDPDNLTVTAEGSSDVNTLNIDLSEEYCYLDLGYWGSLQYSSADKHIGLEVSAEWIGDDVSLQEYVAEYGDYYASDARYSGISVVMTTLGGRECGKVSFTYTGEDASSYVCDVYLFALRDNYFLFVLASYWPVFEGAGDVVYDVLDAAIRIDD